MKILNVDLGERSYPIFIGSDLFEKEGLVSSFLEKSRAVVITNSTVAPLYLEPVRRLLGDHYDSVVILPDGEEHKNLDSVGLIYEHLMRGKYDRKTTLIALGGGVIGDITGYAAATFMRGVKFIQIPTTLLSQVDSSVGGKTGINHALGKNMIGAFYQPQCVIADADVLKTLPDRELSGGIAEIIKYGLIRDYPFFEWLENNMSDLLNKKTESLIEAILRSCINKAEVVSQDEFESSKGIRATLNLGHTFGHAIENAIGYGNWLHGEAVACGMVMAAFLSKELSWLTETDFNRIKNIILSAKLPIDPPNISQEKFIDLMQSDKKTHNNQIHLVLQKGLGKAMLTHDYSEKAFLHTLQQKTFS